MLGDCLEQLKELADNSVDSIVTDPPYGLSFMGKAWDYDVPTQAIWKECLRVLKPGGHLLAFGGTRTYHRLVVNIEDAGFEIRDQIMWIYGSGFPKSMDISKAIDKEAGAEREVIGPSNRHGGGKSFAEGAGGFDTEKHMLTAPATPEAQKWSGYGTALKPANEPICLARKPLSEKTVAKNVLKHGVGGLNIEASRIGNEQHSYTPRLTHNTNLNDDGWDKVGYTAEAKTVTGRFPANILFDEAAAAVLDEQTQHLHSVGSKKTFNRSLTDQSGGLLGVGNHTGEENRYGDSGGASRFFYVAKASKKDRGEGNTHPTVKPIKLMEYLVKLVTPEGGTVLDPFMGSGTTGVAALGLGFKFVGVERDEKYFEICEQRIRDTLAARKLARLALNKSEVSA